MIQHGVSRKDAAEFATGAPEEARRQLDYLPYREARDPGAVLVKSIREGWSAPPAYLEAQTKARRAEAAQKKRTETRHQTRQVEAEQSSVEAAFDAWWEAQPETERGAWTAAAEAQLRAENGSLAEFGQKHPRSRMYLEGLRGYRKRVSGHRPT